MQVKSAQQFAKYNGFCLNLNPEKDGNCQFAAIAAQLRFKSNKKSLSVPTITGSVVWEEVVNYLDKFPHKFTQFNADISWDDYVNKMKLTTTFGDHLTLYAACCLYDVAFLVLDTMDESRCVLVSAKEDDEIELGALSLLDEYNMLCILGYYPEGKGAHYVSLEATSSNTLHAVVKQILEARIKTAPIHKASSTNDPTSNIAIASIPTCVKLKSWLEWMKTRPWLVSENNTVFCTSCKLMAGKSFALMKGSDSREDCAFTQAGVSASSSKKLLKKIDKHATSKRHEACVHNIELASRETARKAFACQQSRFEELNASKIIATEKVFRVAYFCAKENIAFTKHPEIIELHKLNGAEMGTLLFSPVICQDIIIHIAREMKM